MTQPKDAKPKYHEYALFNEYQDAAQRDSWHPRGAETKHTESEAMYLALSLNTEAGEVGDIVKKSHRGDYDLNDKLTKKALLLERGDCLWYIARLADELGFDLSQVAAANLQKIRQRKERNELHKLPERTP